MFKLDPLNVETINSKTLPEAADLANGLLSNAAAGANHLMGQAAELVADTLTQGDAIANRAIDRLEDLVKCFEGGLELRGSIGGIPFEATLKFPDAK